MSLLHPIRTTPRSVSLATFFLELPELLGHDYRRDQAVVKVWRRTETGEAPRGQGATTENTGCIRGRSNAAPGDARPSNAARVSPRAASFVNMVVESIRETLYEHQTEGL